MTNLEELEALIRRNLSLAEARVDTRSVGQWKQALELVEAMGWQDISTAPKDEKVLMCFGEPFFGKMTFEIEAGYLDEESGKWRFWASDKDVVGHGVTHWMPIP